MRVALRTAGGVIHWLAGQPGVSERIHSSASNYRKSAVILTQKDEFIRASQARFRDRRNVATSLSFGTSRKFDTAVAAGLWAADYEQYQPTSGLLILEWPIPGGGQSRRFMDGAIVHPPQIEVIGVSVQLTYAVDGGIIKPTPPAGVII